MAGTNPIPQGFHTVSPHIIVKDGGRAIDFYKKAFGAQEVTRMPGPDGKSVMHAELKIGDSVVMMASEFPEHGILSPESIGNSPVTLHLYVKDCDAAMKKAETAGCKVTMAAQDMFWGDRYGKLTDPFGHHWSIATHTEDVTPAECAKRAAAMFGGGECGKA